MTDNAYNSSDAEAYNTAPLEEFTSADIESQEHGERMVPKIKHIRRDLMDVTTELGHAPSQEEYSRHGRYEVETVLGFYGDWSATARAVGRGGEANE